MIDRLPFDPLEREVGVETKALAEVLGVSVRQVWRWRRDGVQIKRADELADRAGSHRWELWPELRDAEADQAVADMEAASEAEVEQRRRWARDWYRRQYDTNPAFREHRREMSRSYYAECADYVRARQRAYYAANAEVIKAKERERYRRNREARLARKRAYYRENRAAILERNAEYKRRRRNGGTIAPEPSQHETQSEMGVA